MIVQPYNKNLNNNYNFNLQYNMNYQGKKKKKKKQKSLINNVTHTTKSVFNDVSRDSDSDNQKIFTKIALLNVRTITEIKLQAVINYIKHNNLHIFGLTETQKSDKEIKLLNIDKFNYKIITHNDNKGKGKGVLLIISEAFEKHIFKIEKFKGRVLSIDFGFKRNKKLRIILVYNISRNRSVKERIEINTKVIQYIKEAKATRSEVICLGDFNMQYKKYKEKKLRNVLVNKALRFFEKLEELNLWDVHKEFLDMDNTKEIFTYISHNKKHASRIDYIWVSENLFLQLADAKIRSFDGHHLDHKMLTFTFDNSGLVTRTPVITCKRNKKIIFEYNETKDEQLERFKSDLVQSAQQWNSEWTVEDKWEFYKKNLQRTKDNYIKKSEISVSINNGNTKDFFQQHLYKCLRYIIFLRRQIKKLSGRTKLRKNWQRYKFFLKKIINKYDEKHRSDYYIVKEKKIKKFLVGQYVSELNSLYDTLYLNLNMKYAKVKNEKIKEAVER